MAEHAHAMVLTKPRTFEGREFPIPDIGADEGVLRVEAAGLCGTDHEQYDGKLAGTIWDVWPVIPGHEILGWVDRIGPEAQKTWGVKEGDRVTVEASIPCGQCFQCAVGRTVLCEQSMGYGLRISSDRAPHLWGGYATHMYLHPRARLHKAPSDVPTDLMSLFNPMSNAVRWALERPELVMGNTVVIAGPGQRGLLCVAVAKMAGAGLIVLTGTGQDAARLALGKQLGADAVVNVEEEDLVERVNALTGGRGVDIFVDVAAGSVEPLLQGIKCVRRGGKIVVAGLKNGRAVGKLVSDDLIMKEITMIGVLSAGWTSTERAIDLIARHQDMLRPLCTHGFPISQADTAIKLLGREIEHGPEPVHIHLEADA